MHPRGGWDDYYHAMKHFFICGLLLAVAGNIGAQNIDLRSTSKIRNTELLNSGRLSVRDNALLHQLSLDPKNKKAVKSAFSLPQVANIATASKMEKPQIMDLAFVTLKNGFTRADLEAAGMNVRTVIGNVAIVEVPISKATELSSHPAINSLQLQRKLHTTMDLARADQNVDAIHLDAEKVGLDRTYTGRYTITGIVDQGFDPHHINFKLNNGTSRVGYLAWLRINAAGNGIVEDHYNYANINRFTTDYSDTYHATHTTGIMAGSYTGPITVAKPWANPKVPEPVPTYETVDCKYYGVAPEADIAVSCGDLQDGFIAMGLEYLLDYSEWEERPLPMVINMSLGASTGAHDPRTPLNQVVNYLGQYGIICVAAGNEGDLKIALNKTFTEEDNSVKSFIYPYYYNNKLDPSTPTLRNGTVEVWSEDETPFKLNAVIYNKSRNYRAALTMDVRGDGVGTYYISDSSMAYDGTEVIGDPTFNKAFYGYVGVGVKIDEETGRYYGMVDYYVYNADGNEGDDETYLLGFEVIGEPGKRIDCYCDGTTTWIDNLGVEGFTDGSMNGSISDLAVADNIIVVGSYNTRNEWLCLDGGYSRYEGDGFRVGDISGFSSFGTLADGRNLPTVCAPGAAIISSVSWPYFKQMPESYINYACSAKLAEDNRVNYWKQEVGTSMSTPFVSGAISLWLEANPDLTVNDVKQIIAKTAIKDEQVLAGDPVRWGAGKFNTLGGLKEAIRMASTESITADGHNDRLIVTPGDGNITVFLGEAKSLDINLYGMDGTHVRSIKADGDETIVDTRSLTSGAYIINVNGRHSKKILVQ